MKRDYEITINYIRFNKDNISIGWSANIGFGVLDIWGEDDTHFEVATECLGKEFYKQVLDAFYDCLLKNYTIIE